MKAKEIALTPSERKRLEQFVSNSSNENPKMCRRASIVLALDSSENRKPEKLKNIEEIHLISQKGIYNIKKRFSIRIALTNSFANQKVK